ncbi:hypothetical protein ACFL3S_06350 [Gemmatimonadota bacterium]
MQIMPIDLTSVIAVIMGLSIVLIPIIGLTARFALKPTVEALSRVFESRGADESLRIMERRIALLEQQVEAFDGSLSKLEEGAEFDRQLQRGGTNASSP